MFLTKKHVSRRTFLRGTGVAVGLPFLDAMVPAWTALAQTAASPKPRMGFMYLPHGAIMEHWTPAAEGTNFELSPILQPFMPFKKQLTIVSGLENKAAIAPPVHALNPGTWLSCVTPRVGQDPYGGVTVDQIAAAHIGQDTPLPSLEVATEGRGGGGACDRNYGCSYGGTISFRTPTTPLPMEADPRAVFERLFGVSDSTDRQSRLGQIRRDRSILDMVTGQLGDLERVLGPGDRTRLTEYVDSIRDVERRIQIAEQQSDRELPTIHQPAGVPESFEAYAKIMYDLLALSWQTDLTRVATFLYGREKSVRTYPEIGVPESHHPISHHQKRADHLEKLAKINTYHVKMFAYFLEKLRATADGDGTLLDHALLVYGAGMSDSDTHFHHNLPVLLAGGGSGQVKGGRHLRFTNEPPLANLHVTLLDKLGLPADRLGDSDGRVKELSDV